MKNFLKVFLPYVFFVSVVVFCLGFFLKPVSNVSKYAEFSFKVTNGFSLLFDFLPSICFTSFLLSCSIMFSDFSDRTYIRFSGEIVRLFKKIVIISVSVTFIITICSLVFAPLQKSKQRTMQTVPVLLAEYTQLSRQYLETNKPHLALQYLNRALSFEPKNTDLLAMQKDVELALKEYEIEQKAERNKSYAETDFNSEKRISEFTDESGMSAMDLLAKAREMFDEKDYFGAHYYSVEAEKLCSQNDPNLQEAKKIAGYAWNCLSSAQMEIPTEGNLFYRRKLVGYTSLLSGNFLDAYYVFHGLSEEDERKARDPDVVRYLAISQANLLKSYFFIDETYDASRFESYNNISFAVSNIMGGHDIVLIRGVSEVEGTGGLLRYLRNLEVYSYDSDGKFVYSMKTPYAKMVGFDTSNMDERTHRMYSGTGGETASVIPYILLCSVSRDSKSVKNEPVYEYARKKEFPHQPRQIFWPMDYSDFSLIMLSSGGQGNMNPFSLNRMARKASDYGYSSEIFSAASLNRIFYPFMILIILIFLATVAWNYRLAKGTVFKFKWILFLPILNMIFYFAGHFIEYLITLLNFVYIAFAGTYYAILAGIIAYIILLAAVSTVFLARKGD